MTPADGGTAASGEEDRLRSVAQSVNDAVVSADRDGRIIFWNSAAEGLLAYSSGRHWDWS